jgi:hypothetical protein
MSGKPSADDVFDNSNNEQAFSLMVQNGLDGVHLQEQNAVSECVEARVSAFHTTRDNYQRILGAQPFEFFLQYRPGSCTDADSSCGASYVYQICAQLAEELAPYVKGIGIWALQSDDKAKLVPLVQALR